MSNAKTIMSIGEKIEALRSLCKCEIAIMFNEHRNSYHDVSTWLDFLQVDEDEASPEVVREMIARDQVVNVQFYPDTPVGFLRVLHYDLEMALEKAVTAVEIDRGDLIDPERGQGAAEETLEDLNPKEMGGLFRTYINPPIEVEAVQFTDEYKDRIYHQMTGPTTPTWENGQPVLKVITIKGSTAIIHLDDWIVKEDMPGCYYPVTNEVFQKTYKLKTES